MIRKIILFGLIVASSVPASIKAAAEPHCPSPKPTVLKVSFSNFAAFDHKPWQDIVGPTADVNNCSFDKTSPADIAAASCVIFDVTPKNYFVLQSPMPIFCEEELLYESLQFGLENLLPVLLDHPQKALIIHLTDRGAKDSWISPGLQQLFGENIFQLTEPNINLEQYKANKVHPADQSIRGFQDDAQLAAFKTWLRGAIRSKQHNQQETYPSRIEEPDYCYVPSEEELKTSPTYTPAFQKRVDRLARILKSSGLDTELYALLREVKYQ